MFGNKNETMPQFVDRFLKRIALAVTIMASSYGSGAFSHLVEGSARDFLLMVKDPLGLLAALIVLPMFIKMMMKIIRSGTKHSAPAGYIAETYGKSAGNGFAAGFIFLVLIEPMSGGMLRHLPPEFFIQSAIAVLLGALGISFFILSRDGNDEIDDEFDDEPEPEAANEPTQDQGQGT